MQLIRFFFCFLLLQQVYFGCYVEAVMRHRLLFTACDCVEENAISAYHTASGNRTVVICNIM